MIRFNDADTTYGALRDHCRFPHDAHTTGGARRDHSRFPRYAYMTCGALRGHNRSYGGTHRVGPQTAGRSLCLHADSSSAYRGRRHLLYVYVGCCDHHGRHILPIQIRSQRTFLPHRNGDHSSDDHVHNDLHDGRTIRDDSSVIPDR